MMTLDLIPPPSPRGYMDLRMALGDGNRVLLSLVLRCKVSRIRLVYIYLLGWSGHIFVKIPRLSLTQIDVFPNSAGTNPFTSICLGFGCGGFQGLDYNGAPAPTDEDSIPLAVFLAALDKGTVVKVEFTSGGNKAYAFLKPTSGNGEPSRIRVGEGYPEEKGNNWSSPLWVVRAVKEKNVPYTFDFDLGGQTHVTTIAK
ncbi:unnamed protein product [Choristocarpus tenellus]